MTGTRRSTGQPPGDGGPAPRGTHSPPRAHEPPEPRSAPPHLDARRPPGRACALRRLLKLTAPSPPENPSLEKERPRRWGGRRRLLARGGSSSRGCARVSSLRPGRSPRPRPVPAAQPPFPESSAVAAAQNGATRARRSPRPSLHRPPSRPSPGSRYPAGQPGLRGRPLPSQRPPRVPCPGRGHVGGARPTAAARSRAPGAALCKGRAGEGSGSSGREGRSEIGRAHV